MTAAFCILILGVFIAVLGVISSLNAARNAFLHGQRVAYKIAISHVKQRGDLAVLLAPAGMLSDGLQRAQVSHQTVIDLHQLLNEVR